MLQWSAYGICHIGKIRGNNQDNLLVYNQIREHIEENEWECGLTSLCGKGIFSVCDGMGGESKGEWASLVAVTNLQRLQRENVDDILGCIQQSNGDICKEMRRTGGKRRGSTCVVAALQGDSVDIINVGDSRGYLWHRGCLKQLSHDHTEWQSRMDMGIGLGFVSEQGKNILTQHLGILPEEMIIEPAVQEGILLESGDVILLCSDGLSGMLTDAEISSVLQLDLPLKQRCSQLVQQALAAGGRDNVTVVLVEIEGVSAEI